MTDGTAGGGTQGSGAGGSGAGEAGLAPAGWYPDPYQPSQLRYWDGAQWTEHVHENADNGSLPSIGDWFTSSFSAIGAYGIPALVLAFGGTLLVGLVSWMPLRWAIGDAAIINDEFVGDIGGMVARLAVLGLMTSVLQGLLWLAISRFMQRAHLQDGPTIAESIRRAIVRFPRLVGIYLLVFFVVGVALAGIVVVVALSGSIALGLLLGLASIPVIVWCWVKTAFISAAVAAVPPSTSALRASAAVSTGRFWPVFGRLLLLTVMLWVGSTVVGSVTGQFAAPIDQEALLDIIDLESPEPSIRDFRFEDMFSSQSMMFAFVVVNSMLGAASGLIRTSALMRLYLDSGAPSET